MPKKKIVKKTTTTTLKNKVIINIGGRSQGGVKKAPVERRQATAQPPTQPPAPQVIFNAINPSLDPFAIKQQLATQQLQHQTQLKVSQDLVNSLKNELQGLKDVRNEPAMKTLNLAPSHVGSSKLDESVHVSLNPEDNWLTSPSSSSSPEYQTPLAAASAYSEKTAIVPSFVKTPAGSLKVVNPKTNRQITYRGEVYKQLVKDGVIIDTYVPNEFAYDDDE